MIKKSTTVHCNILFIQEGATSVQASDDQSPLGQAFLKYLDALAVDETKPAHHFHVGRMLVVQGRYDDAIERLESSICISDQQPLARSVELMSWMRVS